MTDQEPQSPVETPEVLPAAADADKSDDTPSEVIEHPSKIMRIGTMIRTLLEEARSAELDERGRDRLRAIYDTSVRELSATMSPDLQAELGRLAHPFAEGAPTPSGSELRVAQAQLVGWLEGLFQGIQATVFAQQMAARQQLEAGRQGLPPGARPDGREARDGRPGTYL